MPVVSVKPVYSGHPLGQGKLAVIKSTECSFNIISTLGHNIIEVTRQYVC